MKILITNGENSYYREVSIEELGRRPAGLLLTKYNEYHKLYKAPVEYAIGSYNHILANILVLYYPKAAKFKDPDLIIAEKNIIVRSNKEAAKTLLTDHCNRIRAFIQSAGMGEVQEMKTDIVEKVVIGVHKEWFDLYPLQNLASVIRRLDKDGKLNNCEPKLENIFAFGRVLKPDDVKGIIAAQNPYPTDAIGIALAKMKNKTASSLATVYSCLQKSGFVSDAKAQSPYIAYWMAQGVLLINAVLTTTNGSTKMDHKDYWIVYVQELIKALVQKKPMFVMLWGREAQTALKHCFDSKKQMVLTYTHPSTTADNRLEEGKRFIHCDHFIKVAQWKIDWDTSKSLFIFTDGACQKNGKSGAKAGAGVYFRGGCLDKSTIQAPVLTGKYYLRNEDYPGIGFEIKDSELKESEDKPKETENKPKEVDVKPEQKPKETENKQKETENKPKEANIKPEQKPKETENKQKETDVKSKEPENKPKEAGNKEGPLPSNNRAELLAIFYAYLSVVRAHYPGKVYIITDSSYAKNCVCEWYIKRKKNGTLNELKNLDLLGMIDTTRRVAETMARSIEFIQVKASHDYTLDEKASDKDKFFYNGNKEADALAREAIDLPLTVKSTLAPLTY